MIKPEFFTSETMAKVSCEAALLAIGLLCYADDEGFFRANEALIAAALFPLRKPSAPILALLDELEAVGFAVSEIGDDGSLLGRIVNFNVHQHINHPTASTIADHWPAATRYRNPDVVSRHSSRKMRRSRNGHVMVTDHYVTGPPEKKRIEDSLRESSFPPAVAGADAPPPPSGGRAVAGSNPADECPHCGPNCRCGYHQQEAARRARKAAKR